MLDLRPNQARRRCRILILSYPIPHPYRHSERNPRNAMDCIANLPEHNPPSGIPLILICLFESRECLCDGSPTILQVLNGIARVQLVRRIFFVLPLHVPYYQLL